MKDRTILLIEDDESLVQTMRYMIEDMGYDLVVATNHAQAKAALAGGPYAVAIVDYLVDNMPTGELIAQLQSRHPRTPVVCSTAAAIQQVQLQQAHAPPNAFLFKPFSIDELRETLHSVVKT
jgi:DNA-binding NtrC family response regulator